MAEKTPSVTELRMCESTNRYDINHDNFTDLALQKRISLFQKWNLTRPENRLASLGARYLYEDRWGGELQWTPEFRGGDSIYGESVYTSRAEIIGTYQLPAPEKLTLQFSYNRHNQNSAYGTTSYIAQQDIAFAQLLWDKKINRHDLLFGLPFRFTYYDDNTPGTRKPDGRNNAQYLYLPGLFVQDEISVTEDLTVMPGFSTATSSVATSARPLLARAPFVTLISRAPLL